MDTNAFGAKLRQLRNDAGLSQHALAKRSGVTRSSIAKFELGEREPLLTTAQRLADALGVDCTAFQGSAAPEKVKPTGKDKAKEGKPRKGNGA